MTEQQWVERVPWWRRFVGHPPAVITRFDEPHDPAYARMPVLMDVHPRPDGKIVATLAVTVTWPPASRSWGKVVGFRLFDTVDRPLGEVPVSENYVVRKGTRPQVKAGELEVYR